MSKSEIYKYFSLFVLFVALILFVYVTVKAIGVVRTTQVSTQEGIYTSYVSTSKEIKQKAFLLTKACKSTLCKVQTILDFTSQIPYKTARFQKNSPQATLQNNYGDCDDKSNLLISMLHALGIEAYFVLVPRHIFVIVPIEDKRLLHKKGLYVNGRKYYILESTAEGSKVGYPLQYRLDEIDTIIEPFSNKKIDIKALEYKL